jgi:hypothetical protein
MKEEAIFISKPDNTKREIDWIELNQLKKDILWIYDENVGEINTGFAPSYSFKLKYWEYLNINGAELFDEEEKDFYRIGTLIIILCFCVEYNCIASGDQKVFDRNELPIILKCVKEFKAKDEPQMRLKEKVIKGLNIALSITERQLQNSDFEHKDLPEFYSNINEIGDDFILEYYQSKLNKN